jgi:hypothetical protein
MDHSTFLCIVLKISKYNNVKKNQSYNDTGISINGLKSNATIQTMLIFTEWKKVLRNMRSVRSKQTNILRSLKNEMSHRQSKL